MKTHSRVLFRFAFVLLMPISALMLSSCVKKEEKAVTTAAPEDTVRRFVEISAAVRDDDDRKRLLELCQGEMRRAFERMTPEAFKVAYTSSAVKIKDLKFVDTKVTEGTAKIHYQVTLDNPHGTDPTQEVNSREVDLVLSGNNWLIENIRATGSDQIAFTRGMIF